MIVARYRRGLSVWSVR